MSNLRRSMMVAGRGSAIDWERIARGMLDYTTPFDITGVEVTPTQYVLTRRGNATGVVTVKDGATEIGNGAFSNCLGLEAVILPNTITKINGDAFSSCKGLTSVNIPSSVTSIWSWAFNYCTGLPYIKIEATTPPTLGAANAFNNTTFPIYVPDASVAAYKAANNWSSLASRIFPISDMPTT